MVDIQKLSWNVKMHPEILYDLKVYQETFNRWSQDLKQVLQSERSERTEEALKIHNSIKTALNKFFLELVAERHLNVIRKDMKAGDFLDEDHIKNYTYKEKHITEELQKYVAQIQELTTRVVRLWKPYATGEGRKLLHTMQKSIDRISFRKEADSINASLDVFVKQKRELENLKHMLREILNAFRGRLQIATERHNVLKECKHKFKKLQPDHARKLRDLLEKEMHSLDVLSGDEESAEKNLSRIMVLLKRAQGNLKGFKIDANRKIRTGKLKSFLNSMISFLRKMSDDIGHTRARIKEEAYFLQVYEQKGDTNFKSMWFKQFLKSWRKEIKSNQALIRHMLSTLNKNKKYIEGIVSVTTPGRRMLLGEGTFIGFNIAWMTAFAQHSGLFASYLTPLSITMYTYATPIGVAIFLASFLVGMSKEYEGLLNETIKDRQLLREYQRQLPNSWWRRI